ncbi:Flagellum-specific peptidoglycan hydrolase FlgJ [Carnobacterium alterfunditum]|uniref:Flagellum-specific peptidoglycan hydrolase FlgJ n=1 Tax=Carnobacterium alterfunditum TaxID=28230 RepID=A0A1N6HPG1_9LACT|nr:glycoside hydrolase family 73 protein [Carnobacterium alterfunditum]SIO21630.1 Flagellum-specific peptidoglycan hydrolase FlgJ [Carnobacterium alterfunditum]
MPLKKQKKSTYKKVKRKGNEKIKPSYFLVTLFIFVFIFLGTLYFLAQETPEIKVYQDKQEEEDQHHFIVQIVGYAKVLQEEYGVLPSISIAQAILESDWGTSELSVKNNNFYGIKGDSADPTVTMTTREFVDGEWIEVNAEFRKYTTWQESMEDHSKLFTKGTTWNTDQYAKVLASKDYKEAAYALQKSGYATDPDYPNKLIRLIEQYDLNQYDQD